ncbi:hypothetical protein CEP54_015780 [Fusarium duplospermum]|uniref:Heterokaryon incompatibility domain-containing protein n=1 Tax=Fusarium duplospermum TaxID=1325734 RepID=A0A428NL92_9HYPO|nr:hypothetical protein CEP54_015780 [Fusarium duplospermum]
MAPSTIYSKPLARNEMRLMILQPGKWNDPILCQLETDTLLKQHRKREYKALSYAWGLRSRSNPPHIQVQDTLFPITLNLECALRHLRLLDEPLVLWVDAVCINQADVSERTTQVSRMGDIYSEATEVIVFLGGGPGRQAKSSKVHKDPGPYIFFTNTSSDDDLTNQVLSDWKKPGQSQPVTALDLFCLLKMLAQPRNPSNPLEPLKGVPINHLAAMFEDLRQMLIARWWDRIWVVQEAVVAKTVTLRYGNVSAPWGMIADAASSRPNRLVVGAHGIVSIDDAKVLNLLSRVEEIDRFRRAWGENDRPNILSLLREFSNRKASDERDKIYALLSLCDYKTGIWPDYSLEVRETYKMATLDIIQHARSLSVLTGDLGRKERQDLPSWVPDWSATFNEHDRRRARLFNYYNACGDANCSIKDSDKIDWHVQSEMELLAMNLERENDPMSLMPAYLSGALQQYKSTHPQFESVCDRLIKCCHPAGKRSFTTLVDRGIMEYEPEKWEGCLKVSGMFLERVEITGRPIFSSSDTPVALQTIENWRGATMKLPPGVTSPRKTDFIETILSGVMKTPTGFKKLDRDDEWTINYWYQRRIELQHASWPHQESDPPTSEALDSLTEGLGLAVANRALFVTKSGKMGLGPTSIAHGDDIYILPGGRLPFVLRNLNYRPGFALGTAFNVVGDCFLHGAMDGTRGFPQQGSLPKDVLDNAIAAMEEEWMGYVRKLEEVPGVWGVPSISTWDGESQPYLLRKFPHISSSTVEVEGERPVWAAFILGKMDELSTVWEGLRRFRISHERSYVYLL